MFDKPKISVIDDDEAVRDALGDLLGALGYPVQTFESARDFIDRAGSATSACLITDVQMPGMSGFELMEHMARTGRSIPTILISAHTQQAMQSRAARQGAVAFLRKPIRQDELVASLRRAVG